MEQASSAIFHGRSLACCARPTRPQAVHVRCTCTAAEATKLALTAERHDPLPAADPAGRFDGPVDPAPAGQ